MKITYYDNTGNVSEVKDFGDMVDSRVMEYSPECELFNISDEELNYSKQELMDEERLYGRAYNLPILVSQRMLLHIDYKNYRLSPYFENTFCISSEDIQSLTNIFADDQQKQEWDIRSIYDKVFGEYCCSDAEEWRTYAKSLIVWLKMFMQGNSVPSRRFFLTIVESNMGRVQFDIDVLYTIKTLGNSHRHEVYNLIATLEQILSDRVEAILTPLSSFKDHGRYIKCSETTRETTCSMFYELSDEEKASLVFRSKCDDKVKQREYLEQIQTQYNYFLVHNTSYIKDQQYEIVNNVKKYVKKISSITTEDWEQYYWHYLEQFKPENNPTNSIESKYKAIIYQSDAPNKFFDFLEDSMLFKALIAIDSDTCDMSYRLEMFLTITNLNYIKQNMGVIASRDSKVYDELLGLPTVKIQEIKDVVLYGRDNNLKLYPENLTDSSLEAKTKEAIAKAMVFLDPIFDEKYIVRKNYSPTRLRSKIYELLNNERLKSKIIAKPNPWGFNLMLVLNIVGLLCEDVPSIKNDGWHNILKPNSNRLYGRTLIDKRTNIEQVIDNKTGGLTKEYNRYVNNYHSNNSGHTTTCIEYEKKWIREFFG